MADDPGAFAFAGHGDRDLEVVSVGARLNSHQIGRAEARPTVVLVRLGADFAFNPAVGTIVTMGTSGFRQRLADHFRRFWAMGETVLLRTHVRKWERVAKQGPPTWDERNTIIARFIPPGSSVIDLGAGAQTLRTHIGPTCRYQPCDVVKSSPDVIFCDFNRGIYPMISGDYDFVVCSGVLEYVRNPREFIERVRKYGRTVLLAYNPKAPGESNFDRMAKHWVNHLRHDELEKIFDDLGLQWKLINLREPYEHLYELTPSTGDAQ